MQRFVALPAAFLACAEAPEVFCALGDHGVEELEHDAALLLLLAYRDVEEYVHHVFA